jgi:hypothetical protein
MDYLDWALAVYQAYDGRICCEDEELITRQINYQK